MPLFGAGCSFDAGMPVVSGIQRYLYKLQFYITKSLWAGATVSTHAPSFLSRFTGPDESPSNLIRMFGWPDRFRIHSELCAYLDRLRLDTTIVELVKESKLSLLLDSQLGSQAELLHALLSRTIEPCERDANWYIEDWRSALAHFTGHNSDLADALMTRLHRDRRPGLTHQYASFLTRLNLWSLYLTFNFDPLFEQALRQQDIKHKVFSLEEGLSFPSELLTRQSVAVVKLHGDTHRLLLDHRLDQPLSHDYLTRIHQCLRGKGNGVPLLVVLGCGGVDRRVMSIVRHFAAFGTSELPSVAWIHYEPYADLPKYIEPLAASKRICLHQAKNPGYFLKELYARLVNRYPSSRVPYIAHSERPILVQSAKEAFNHVLSLNEHTAPDYKQTPFILFYTTRRSGDFQLSTASHCLAEAVGRFQAHHYVLWINVESCYSLFDLVNAVIDAAKRYDTGITPTLLHPFGESAQSEEQVVDKAVMRVLRILQRSNFLLAVDGVETISWMPTDHHGIGGAGIVRDQTVKHVIRFLVELQKQSHRFHGSKVFASYDQNNALDDNLTLLQSQETASWCVEVCDAPGDEHVRPKTVPELEDGLAMLVSSLSRPTLQQLLFRLSCFRRTRGLAEIRRVMRESVSAGTTRTSDLAIDGFLDSCTTLGFLVQVEGGGLWMNRSVRNAVYRHFTDQRGTELQPVLTPTRVGYVSTCFHAATEHDAIATMYFDDVYMMSRDSSAFLEYLFHRMASLRYSLCLLNDTRRNPASTLESLNRSEWSVKRNQRDFGDWVSAKSEQCIHGSECFSCYGYTSHVEGDLDSFLLECERFFSLRCSLLLDAVIESEEQIRSQLPVGQLAFLSQWMADKCIGLAKDITGETKDIEKARSTLEKVKERFSELLFESCFERMDFESAVAMSHDYPFPSANDFELKRKRAQWHANLRDCISGKREVTFENIVPLREQSVYSGTDEQRHTEMVWKMSVALSACEMFPDVLDIEQIWVDCDFNSLRRLFFAFATDGRSSAQRLKAESSWQCICRARRISLVARTVESDEWEEAYRALDEARAMASDESPHLRGIVELFTASVTRFYIQSSEFGGDGVPSIRTASKIRLWRMSLDRATDYLRVARRNTRWWRFLNRLELQWSTWSLIGLAREMDQVSDGEGSRDLSAIVADAHSSLRHGLDAIRVRIDLDNRALEVAGIHVSANFPAMREWWWCLVKAAYLVFSRLKVSGEEVEAEIVKMGSGACSRKTSHAIHFGQYMSWVSQVAWLCERGGENEGMSRDVSRVCIGMPLGESTERRVVEWVFKGVLSHRGDRRFLRDPDRGEDE